MVVYWKQYEDKVEGENGEVEMKVRRVLRYSRAFNIDQCEGVDERRLPVIEERPVGGEIALCEALLAGYEGAPRVEYGGDKAFYSPFGDYVGMPERGDFESLNAFYHVVFHEMAHSTGYFERLGRFERTYAVIHGGEDYSREELVAEMASCFMANDAGIDMDISNSAAYIGSWLKKLKDNPKWVVQAAGMADKSVGWIKGQREALRTGSEALRPKGEALRVDPVAVTVVTEEVGDKSLIEG